MTKPPRPLRDSGRLDELILNAVLGQTLAAQGSATTLAGQASWRCSVLGECTQSGSVGAGLAVHDDDRTRAQQASRG